MIIRDCQETHPTLAKKRPSNIDAKLCKTFKVSNSPCVGVIKNGQESQVEFSQVVDLWQTVFCNIEPAEWLNHLPPYLQKERDLCKTQFTLTLFINWVGDNDLPIPCTQSLFTQFTSSDGARNTKKIIRLISQLNPSLTANSPLVQNFIREWTKLFFHEDIYFRIAWDMRDFGELGHTQCDSQSCFNAKGCHSSHPVGLYHNLHSFIVWLSYSPHLINPNQKDFGEFCQARAWGFLNPANGYLYLSNFYYKGMINSKRLLVRALEAAVGEGILEFSSKSIGVGVYLNGDSICIHKLGEESKGYTRDCACMICDGGDMWICQDCQNSGSYDHNCHHCDMGLYDDDTFYGSDDEPYCETHYHRFFAPCERCNETLEKESEDTISNDNGYYHDSCYSEVYGYCRYCGEDVKRDYLQIIDSFNGDICDACLSGNFSKCDECGEYFETGSLRGLEGTLNSYCEDCFDSIKPESGEAIL